MIRTIFVALFVSTAAIGSWALAHTGATGIVKERMMAMKAIGEATKGIADLAWADVESARAEGLMHAKTLRKHALEIEKLFPKDSINGPSEAVPAIWEKPDAFRRIADDLVAAADALSSELKHAEDKDDIARSFGAVAATCKACHADFRKKKQ